VPTVAGDYGRVYDSIYETLVNGAPKLGVPLRIVSGAANEGSWCELAVGGVASGRGSGVG
jgi:hypothetical protein